jgi:hypothetical protein
LTPDTISLDGISRRHLAARAKRVAAAFFSLAAAAGAAKELSDGICEGAA